MKKNTKFIVYKLNGGIKSVGSEKSGAIKNLTLKDGCAEKRFGHRPLIKITDKNLSPLRINGIFDFSYVENGVPILEKIIHAGNGLFKVDKDFTSFKSINLEDGVTVKDQKSNAFLVDGCLFLVGCGDLLIYDGKSVKSAYKHEKSYIPTTRMGIRDQAHGMKYTEGEGENLLTPRRRNTFVGTSIKRTDNLASRFILDGEIDFSKKAILEIKLRTRTSEETPNETTTNYIGINRDGEEVGTVVTLRYEREFINDEDHFFLNGPIRDRLGEEIDIKISDRIYKWNELPFGVSIRNGNEMYLGFEVTSPSEGEANIVLEYEAKTDSRELLKSAEIGCLTNGYGGGEVLLLTLGGADVYFSDEKQGPFYLSKTNKATLGSHGERITALTPLWDNVFGAFKEGSFFRVKLTSNGYELYSSSDSVGAYSMGSVSRGDGDCLVFNQRGIFGVEENKSSTNVVSALYPRSSDINSLLSAYNEDEKRDAHALFFDGYYYLFIGDDVYCAELSKKQGKEYFFTRWTGCGGRVAHADRDGIYFGTSKGEIRKFFDGYYDLYAEKISKATLSLILNNEGDVTRIILDSDAVKNVLEGREGKELYIKLSSHRRLLTRESLGKDRSLLLNSFNFGFDGHGIFAGDTVSIFDKNGYEAYKGKISFCDPVSKIVTFEDDISFIENEKYSIYKWYDTFEYKLISSSDGYLVCAGDKSVKVASAEEGEIILKCDILCEYQTEPMVICRPGERGTIIGAHLYVSDSSEGDVTLTVYTRDVEYQRKISLGSPLDLNSLTFDGLSLDYPFERILPIGIFLRNPQIVTAKISSLSSLPIKVSEINLIRR